MPVLLDRVSRDHHLFMGDDGDCAKALADSVDGMVGLNIGLVNNMPDSALVPTERQLFELLNAAAGKLPVHLRLYTLPTIPRAEWGQRYISRFYSSVEDLRGGQLDGLIVTGTEPRAPNLAEEPYWDSFVQLVDWAKENTTSAIWSCLAVHGAVLYLDGINRSPLANKCIGVFDQDRMIDHPLLHGISSRLKIPHSRWNEIGEVSLASSGYSIITKSAAAGVDAFVKQQRNSLFVYFQGHPEYDAQSLLGEYRRDVGRFLRREIESYPTMPKGYFDADAEDLLTAFQRHALSDRRIEVFGSFPVDTVATNLKNSWRSAAIRIYQNWISYLSSRADRQQKSPGDFVPSIGSAVAQSGSHHADRYRRKHRLSGPPSA